MGVDARFLARTRSPLTDRDVLRLSYRMCASIGPERFWLDRKRECSDWRKSPHALERIDVFEQDGPDIVPADGETFVRCHTTHRYYGIGYERGDWTVLRAIGDWLSANVGEVMYGGDSSGILAEPWASARPLIDAHWLKHGTFPYAGRDFGSHINRECPLCLEPMIRNGDGPGGWALMWCPGCDREDERRDGVWTQRAEEKHG